MKLAFTKFKTLIAALIAGADVKMVRVGEDDLRSDFIQFPRGHRLDGGLRAHRHKDRRLDIAVGRIQDAAPGVASGVLFNQVEGDG